MKTVHVVAVPSGRPPLLPSVCVVCGRAGVEPLETMQMSDDNGRVDFYLYGIANEPDQGSLLPVPVHAACARTLRNAALKRLAAVAAGWAIAGSGGILLGVDALFAFAAATIAATPFLYLEFTRPVPLEFWFADGKYCLAFSDRKLAGQVARLNDADVTESTPDGRVVKPGEAGSNAAGRGP